MMDKRKHKGGGGGGVDVENCEILDLQCVGNIMQTGPPYSKRIRKKN